jgi:hypothetical protein
VSLHDAQDQALQRAAPTSASAGSATRARNSSLG